MSELVTTSMRELLIEEGEQKKINQKTEKYEHHFLASPHPSLVTRSKKGCERDEEELI